MASPWEMYGESLKSCIFLVLGRIKGLFLNNFGISRASHQKFCDALFITEVNYD